MRRFLVLGVAVAAMVLAVLGGAGAAAGRSDELAAVRAATARFHSLDAALAGGYGVFHVCTDETGLGAMGQHYVNGGLVGDAVLDPAAPEAIMFEPKADGGERLVGVEWVVFKTAWEDAGNTGVPSLFGRSLKLVSGTEPLRHPGLLPAPRLGLEAEPGRHLRGLEPARLVPRHGRLIRPPFSRMFAARSRIGRRSGGRSRVGHRLVLRDHVLCEPPEFVIGHLPAGLRLDVLAANSQGLLLRDLVAVRQPNALDLPALDHAADGAR
jgi:hypothetical protein